MLKTLKDAAFVVFMLFALLLVCVNRRDISGVLAILFLMLLPAIVGHYLYLLVSLL